MQIPSVKRQHKSLFYLEKIYIYNFFGDPFDFTHVLKSIVYSYARDLKWVNSKYFVNKFGKIDLKRLRSLDINVLGVYELQN